MHQSSRTHKSIKNSIVAIGMYGLNLILQFYSRKVFLDYLGTEILGLNTTAVNILQFLNLAELGVWSAIASSLYKPLHQNDTETINKIITFNGMIYHRIAWIIIIAAAIVMLFFPLIFQKMRLPLWYAYASFGVLLYSSLLGYFVNYKQFLLSADQKDYKIQYSYKLSMSIKVLAQIVVLQQLANPYLWWLILEVIFSTLAAVSLNYVIKRTYPYLKKHSDNFKSLRKQFPGIIIKIKQLFIQKISGFVLFQTSPLIIYSLSTLTLVSLYGNYLLIIQGLISLMAALFNSLLAGIGNLVASTPKEYAIKVFYELFSIRFYIIGLLSYGTWLFTQPFVEIWIGEQYLLPNSTLIIMILTFFFYVNRYLVYDYLTAHGYFGDVWASIIEVFLNIGLSIILGIHFGLNGVLIGVLISLLIMSILWKPYYLFTIKLKISSRRFYWHYLKSILILLTPIIILESLRAISEKLIGYHVEYGILCFIIFIFCYTTLIIYTDNGFKQAVKKILNSVVTSGQ